jgi:hypothetical protein
MVCQCPLGHFKLVAIFGMPIWHSINEGEVDALLAAHVDVYVLQLRLSSVGSFVTRSCAVAWMLDRRRSSLFIYSMRSLCMLWMKFYGI